MQSSQAAHDGALAMAKTDKPRSVPQVLAAWNTAGNKGARTRALVSPRERLTPAWGYRGRDRWRNGQIPSAIQSSASAPAAEGSEGSGNMCTSPESALDRVNFLQVLFQDRQRVGEQAADIGLGHRLLGGLHDLDQ